MSDSLREDLLGYLLGVLDPQRQAEVEQYLAEDAEARRQLALLNRALAPLDATRREYAPPPDLAARTCRFVAAQTTAPEAPAEPNAAGVVSGRRPSAVRMHAVESSGGEDSRFRWQDLVMAAGVVVAASILLFPAIHGSRVQARLLACQNNLRKLGTALTDYSEYHEGFFPEVPTTGNLAAASAYAPILAASPFLDEDQLDVVCPDSSLAEADSFSIPTLEEVEAADSPEQVKAMQETMGGSYGYSLGYQEDGEYRPTENLRRASFALASDAPSPSLPSHLSENHGRLGQNVLFEDGHVRFLTSPQPSDSGGDDFFMNDDGVVAAGLHQNDAVIGAGATPPIQYVGE